MLAQFSILLVPSTSYAVRAENLLARAGIEAKLIPVPRKFSSNCGVCLRIAQADLDRALEVLKKGKLEPEAVHDL